MSGFDNDVLFFDQGIDTRTEGAQAVENQMTTDGQLLIAASSGQKIRVGSLVSTDATVSFTYSEPSSTTNQLDLSAGSAVPTSFVTDSGTATPSGNEINIVGGTDISVSGSGNTVTIDYTGTAGDSLPIGTILNYGDADASSFSGSGTWLECNGQTVSQATYATLYARIGLLYTNVAALQTSGTSSNINAVIYDGSSLFVYGTSGGGLRTSTDGITWDSRTSGTTSNINAFTFGDLYVYGTSGGGLSTSTDAITWTARTSGTTSHIQSMGYDGSSLYFYGTVSGGLSTSTDAITWDARTSGSTSTISAMAFGNSTYVYGASDGEIRTSTDGITWDAQTQRFNSQIRNIVFGNGVFVACDASTLATSTDGITWTGTNYKAYSPSGRLTFDGTDFVMVQTDELLRSNDGYKWSRVPIILNVIPNSVASSGNQVVAVANTGVLSTYTKTFSYNTGTEFILPDIYPQDGYNQLFFNSAWIKALL